ncbi:hypothetical protein ACQP1V_07805 [Microtetraspora malaysiensis]|uniref:hypothetical protein n=1 Tax=Microtetraspora malaysiensis TaxID=161358 RepID=UPI003D936FEF
MLFRRTDDKFIRARGYGELVWKPALVAADTIPAPEKDTRARKRFTTSRKEGLHQLRHYYASIMPAGAVDTGNPASRIREAGFLHVKGYFRSWRAMTRRWIWLVSS